jgi:nucleotidyltransferase substrate binding protein (TIGR01987 family)
VSEAGLKMKSANAPSTQELKNAVNSLKISSELLSEAIKNEPQNTELHKALRDACIQRFEFCVELSWKTAVKALGLEIKSPNSAIRDMARNNLIDDTQVWFDLLVARNKTSHTYNDNVAKEVYEIAEKSICHFENLRQKIESLLK